jgi:hypothetical protein
MPEEVRIFQSARQPLHWAIAVSAACHAAVLFYPRLHPEIADRPARRLEARLVPRPSEPLAAVPAPAISPPAAKDPPARQKLLAVDEPQRRPAPAAPQAWSKADKADMDQFIRELEPPARASPDLAQRALAMARAVGRQQARQDDESEVLVERRPDGPPPDPVSLEMYMDSLVKKLNRSAAFVKNDPRSLGVKTAAVLVRIGPGGALQSFKVLYSGDQKDEIAYIQSVVERAAPFAAFPADLQKSVNSVAMMICILPAHLSGGGIGFARIEGGRC